MQQSGQHKNRAELQQDQQNTLFKLQSDLLQTWSSLHVEEYYQNLVLNYLDTLPTYKVQQQITKQIKATNQGKSPYFKLSNNLSSRKQSLSALESLINMNSKKPDVDSQSLTSICSLLASLRDSNLLFAETLIQLLRQYSMNQDPVTDQCMQMFQNLDQDNRFLKQSFLKDFVLFKQQYDPFLLHHYDMKGKKSPKRQSEIIDHLFTLSLSYVCRLLKANNQIIQIVKEGKMTTIENLESRLNSRRMSENIIKRKKTKHEIQKPQEAKNTPTPSFRRRHFSLNQTRQKAFQESKSSFYKRSENSSNQVSKEEESENSHSPDNRSQYLQGGFRRNLKTESKETEERRFIPQNFRIKPIHPKQPFNEQQNKSTITIQQQAPSSFKRKFINIKNRLHPLKHFKKLYLQMTNNNEDQQEKAYAPKLAPINKPPSIARIERARDNQNEGIKTQESSQTLTQKVYKKQIKLRPGKYQVLELLKLLKKLPLKKKSRQVTISEPLQQSLRKQQSYVSQFLLDDQIHIVAVSVVLSHQVYLIRLWALLESCSEQTSASLFKKYLDYLQKMTQLTQIHYEGEFMKEMQMTGFQKVRENYYVRTRVSKPNTKVLQFQPFLSLKCSNIIFQQQNPQAKLLYSQDIQGFSQENAYGCKQLITIDKLRLNENLKMLSKISEGIQNMKTLNILLQDENLDTYQVNSKSKISNIRALRLNFQTAFLSPFLSSDGYLRFIGESIMSSDKVSICSVYCSKNRSKLYFGKGVKSLQAFRQNLTKKGKQNCSFSVKMFSKQLYGRISSSGLAEGCYGYWQINLSWQDELQGKTRHPMTNCEHFGPESFYVAVQIEKQLAYCFQVDEKDFLL